MGHVQTALEVILSGFSPPGIKKDPLFLLQQTQEGLVLPHTMLGDRTCLEVAASLLLEATGLAARIAGTGWIDLRPYPLVDDTNRVRQGVRFIGVPFAFFLPQDSIENRGNYLWLTLSELSNVQILYDHREILLALCKQI
jgi:hypothetical protein